MLIEVFKELFRKIIRHMKSWIFTDTVILLFTAASVVLGHKYSVATFINAPF